MAKRRLIDEQELTVIDDERKAEVLKRLNRIEGQIRGLKEMVSEGRLCVDILQQVASTHEALRGVGKEMMRNYLENCATNGIRSGEPEEAERVYQELIDMMYKYAR